jgi:hypothetical protein
MIGQKRKMIGNTLSILLLTVALLSPKVHSVTFGINNRPAFNFFRGGGGDEDGTTLSNDDTEQKDIPNPEDKVTISKLDGETDRGNLQHSQCSGSTCSFRGGGGEEPEEEGPLTKEEDVKDDQPETTPDDTVDSTQANDEPENNVEVDSNSTVEDATSVRGGAELPDISSQGDDEETMFPGEENEEINETNDGQENEDGEEGESDDSIETIEEDSEADPTEVRGGSDVPYSVIEEGPEDIETLHGSNDLEKIEDNEEIGDIVETQSSEDSSSVRGGAVLSTIRGGTNDISDDSKKEGKDKISSLENKGNDVFMKSELDLAYSEIFDETDFPPSSVDEDSSDAYDEDLILGATLLRAGHSDVTDRESIDDVPGIEASTETAESLEGKSSEDIPNGESRGEEVLTGEKEEVDASTPVIAKSISREVENILIKDCGFRKAELRGIKPEIANVMAEKRLRRPQEGIPDSWYNEKKKDLVLATIFKILSVAIPLALGTFVVRNDLDLDLDFFKSFGKKKQSELLIGVEKEAAVKKDDSELTIPGGESDEHEEEISEKVKPVPFQKFQRFRKSGH